MIVTISTSYKFKDKIENIYKKLVKEGNIVLYPDFDIYEEKTRDMVQLFKIHFEKIKISDALYVIDIDGYIGESIAAEIAYAYLEGKKILYWSKRSFE